MFKKNIVFVVFLFFSFFSFAQKELIGTGQTLRLEVSNLKMIERGRTTALFQLDLMNIGKEDIDLPFNTPIENIEVVFDDSLNRTQYAYYQYLIKEQLGVEELNIPVGLVKTSFPLEIILPKENKKNNSIKVAKNVFSTDSSVVKRDTFLLKKVKKYYDFSLFSKDSLYRFFKKDSNFVRLECDTFRVLEQGVFKKIPHCAQSFQYSFTTKDTSLAVKNVEYKPDFRIDTCFVKKQDKKSCTIVVKCSNIGNVGVFMLGETPLITDNFSAKTYFSALQKYSNGAIFARGMYIEKETQNIGNYLQIGQQFSFEMEIPLKNKSKFTPFLIVEINANQSIDELTTDNNFYFLSF
jgi:hypothetical protein